MANTALLSLTKTWEGTHMTDLFLKPILAVDDYTKNFRVMSNVVGKTNIYFRTRAQKIMKKVENCSFTEKGSLTITDKECESHNVGVHVRQCWSEFKETIFEQEWLKSGTDKHDLTGTVVETMLLDFIREGMARDIARMLWWGKAASASADFNWFDGWFRCMIDNSASLGYLLDITTYETASALDPDAAMDIFENLIENAPSNLLQLGKQNLRFYVSRGILHNYESSLRGTQQTDSAFNTVIDGVKKESFNGIEIVMFAELDEDMADADNEIAQGVSKELNTTSNNVVILTTPENLVITLDGNNLKGNDAQIWFSQDDDELKGRVNTMLGACCFLPELFVVAY